MLVHHVNTGLLTQDCDKELLTQSLEESLKESLEETVFEQIATLLDRKSPCTAYGILLKFLTQYRFLCQTDRKQ